MKNKAIWQREIIPSDDSLPTHFLISNISQHTIDLMDYIFSVKQVVYPLFMQVWDSSRKDLFFLHCIVFSPNHSSYIQVWIASPAFLYFRTNLEADQGHYVWCLQLHCRIEMLPRTERANELQHHFHSSVRNQDATAFRAVLADSEITSKTVEGWCSRKETRKDTYLCQDKIQNFVILDFWTAAFRLSLSSKEKKAPARDHGTLHLPVFVVNVQYQHIKAGNNCIYKIMFI